MIPIDLIITGLVIYNIREFHQGIKTISHSKKTRDKEVILTSKVNKS